MSKVARRHLMKAGLAASLFAATGLPLRAQQRGGTLRLGLNGAHSTDTWDSRNHQDQFMMVLGQGCVFDCLTEIKATGELVGELATHWEGTPDAKTWVIHLRHGVKFHDGASLEADDVVASFQHHIATQAILANVATVRKHGPYAVEFILSQGDPDFPFLLSDYHLLIYPGGDVTASVGTGLYRIDQFTPGRFASAQRVADHYKDGTAGWFDRVELQAFNTDAARVNALIEGQVDAINDLPPQFLPILDAHPQFQVLDVTGNRHIALSFDTAAAPFNDPNLQNALRCAIDRQAILDQIAKGHGHIGQDHPFGPLNQYLDTSIKAAPFDPNQAKAHLQMAGITELHLDLLAPEGLLFEAACCAAQSARLASIHINVIQTQMDGYWDKASKHPFHMSYWNGQVTENWALTAGGHQIMQDDLALVDKQKAYSQIQHHLTMEGSMIIPLFPNYLDVTTSKLTHNGYVGTQSPLDSNRIAERWWFA